LPLLRNFVLASGKDYPPALAVEFSSPLGCHLLSVHHLDAGLSAFCSDALGHRILPYLQT